MQKLKNTPTNKMILFAAYVGGGALLLRKLAKDGDKGTFTMIGAVLGIIVLGGTSRFVLEPKKKV